MRMAQRISSVMMAAGVGFAVVSSCVYVVDPGEKALIMNQLSGLKKTVYNQGYNFKIPFIEVGLCIK